MITASHIITAKSKGINTKQESAENTAIIRVAVITAEIFSSILINQT